ncbi:hypothetical protein GCM10009766_00050 [Microcella frigidaquae]
MCNGWNHPKNCRCGWGGEGHKGRGGGGGYGYSGWSAVDTWGGGSSLDSPNAMCPKCESPVYFIRPQNGGAVWFDELGKPWPKHPCMETLRARNLAPTYVPTSREVRPAPDGWTRRTEPMTIAMSESFAVWAGTIGRSHYYFLEKPLEPLSPAFIGWDKSDRRKGTIEFLVASSTGMREQSYTIFRPSNRYLNQQVEIPTRKLWIPLVTFVEAYGNKTPRAARELVARVRERTEWLIEPGWYHSEASRHLVLGALKKLLVRHRPLHPEQMLRWMRLLTN